MEDVRIIAYYLPQYHPIPENDEWWGKGFTEWTNVGKAVPLFKGHYQPRVPLDLGYYDLRLPQVREEQAELARMAGIECFCYWHYWFGNGKELIEKPFNDVVKSGQPNFPFCLAWANDSWTAKSWNTNYKNKQKYLIEQLYPGPEDNLLHYNRYKKAFADSRYIRVNDRPLFLIYRPFISYNINEFIEQWNSLINKSGIADSFYFVACTDEPSEHEKALNLGFDAITNNPVKRMRIPFDMKKDALLLRFLQRFSKKPFKTIDYKEAVKYLFTEEEMNEDTIPIIMPNWDRSPRGGSSAVIWHNSRPSFFKEHAIRVLKNVRKKKNKLVFLKSWNEWAEGNYMEPDLRFGHGYINALREAIEETK